MSAPNGRAVTQAQKRAVIERIYAAWLTAPEQRLAQLLVNAHYSAWFSEDIFYLEDENLATDVEQYAKDVPRRDNEATQDRLVDELRPFRVRPCDPSAQAYACDDSGMLPIHQSTLDGAMDEGEMLCVGDFDVILDGMPVMSGRGLYTRDEMAS